MTSYRLESLEAEFRAAATESASEVLGRLRHGVRICGLTKGQFSLMELILAVVEQIGPCDVIATTWSTSFREAEVMGALLGEKRFRSLRILTDRNFRAFNAERVDTLISVLGEERLFVTAIHAKVAVLRNERWGVVIRSSMNFNRNPRIEQFDLDEGAGFCGWWWDQMEALIATCQKPSDFSAEGAGRAFKSALLPPAGTSPKQSGETRMERMRREMREHRERVLSRGR